MRWTMKMLPRKILKNTTTTKKKKNKKTRASRSEWEIYMGHWRFLITSRPSKVIHLHTTSEWVKEWKRNKQASKEFVLMVYVSCIWMLCARCHNDDDDFVLYFDHVLHYYYFSNNFFVYVCICALLVLLLLSISWKLIMVTEGAVCIKEFVQNYESDVRIQSPSLVYRFIKAKWIKRKSIAGPTASGIFALKIRLKSLAWLFIYS